jgi:hypothetical protein
MTGADMCAGTLFGGGVVDLDEDSPSEELSANPKSSEVCALVCC